MISIYIFNVILKNGGKIYYLDKKTTYKNGDNLNIHNACFGISLGKKRMKIDLRSHFDLCDYSNITKLTEIDENLIKKEHSVPNEILDNVVLSYFELQ